MIQVPPSPFLRMRAPFMKAVVNRLRTRFDYASALGTDCSGLYFQAATGETRAQDSEWGERGFVIRVQRDGAVAEFSFNAPTGGSPEIFADGLAARLEPLLADSGARRYPALADGSARVSSSGEMESDPFDADPEGVLESLCAIRDRVLGSGPEFPYARALAEFMRVSKVFVSPARDLEQSFVWGQAYIMAMARRGEIQRFGMETFSGRKGTEIIDEMNMRVDSVVAAARALLDAGPIEPGEYDVVLTPEATGLLAHEAFGHGVETDMFVKNRARASQYLGKGVASPIVTMYDGADGAIQTGSFLFDDEGTLATKTMIIDRGILVSGISDSLSAMTLGAKPTGNGRRQDFAHKAYARMTNTYIAPGSSTADEIIASVKYGWMLCDMDSGMEDPKNWGIQLVFNSAKEIRDGKLTGRVASPVVCSGYVPDVLSGITMVSGDFELSGTGYCGKGYKEFVKVSAGGPYVRTRMRLG
ncbi:MAG: TldD/PmbA family protein [Spirochaetes bacterium]|nr:TldD/PmbA family protein [Spirochaetota bacterium]